MIEIIVLVLSLSVVVFIISKFFKNPIDDFLTQKVKLTNSRLDESVKIFKDSNDKMLELQRKFKEEELKCSELLKSLQSEAEQALKQAEVSAKTVSDNILRSGLEEINSIKLQEIKKLEAMLIEAIELNVKSKVKNFTERENSDFFTLNLDKISSIKHFNQKID